ncbi:type VII secretion protein EccCa [Mycobacterium parmense]|nr:type VII secretion protein EccCa [Mycobacterium parmense]ORW48509.1 secretion protein EccC [Mycobacterium parmense]
MTNVFAPAPRRRPPACATADVAVTAPPAVPSPGGRSTLMRLAPIAMSVVSLGVVAVAFVSGSGMTRNPMFLVFPVTMLVSMVTAAFTGGGRASGAGVDTDRADYLAYLSRLREQVIETAAAQRLSLCWSHPDPDTLWTLVGGPRMWERRAGDDDFGLVRIGFGTRPLATRLVAPDLPEGRRRDPVTVEALQRFLGTYSTIDAPITIDLRAHATVTIDGDTSAVRGVLRALICQLAVLHPPDQLSIVGAVGDRHAEWDWLKWLPHNRHAADADALGAARMVYRNPAQALEALGHADGAHAVVVADLGERAEAFEAAGATVLRVGAGGDGAPVIVRASGAREALSRPDRLGRQDALVCARRLAGYRPGSVAKADWAAMAGVGDVAEFDPARLWRNGARLTVPIGTADGGPVELDIKEAAAGGMGPHGLCVGATGSGKSELLRTIALGMVARNSPEALNLLLVDFKGGATFLEFAAVPHVSAVITNLAEEAPMVARMREALAGELNRRQRVLRAAGCGSVADYERARRDCAGLAPLPTLLVVVDEFSELLSQQPEFAETFAAIGRLGRSLGVHLLLASQRLDEGRLRGLEAHLSYRICLKTMSAAESRAVLGSQDAYELPSTPGAGLLRVGGGGMIRFQAAYASGPRCLPPSRTPTAAAALARPFTTRPAGRVTRPAARAGTAAPTVLGAILDRLSAYGPPAHRVWLPPLDEAPSLDAVLRGGATAAALTVPIGIVDRPFEQRRTPLVVDLSGAAGNVAIVGAPQSGKSTALRSLITALAATHDARRVQFYCLDLGGGALASLRPWPHVGAVAGRAEPRLAARIVAECESVVRSREALFGCRGIASMGEYRRRRPGCGDDPFGDVFLVIDGWATLRREFEDLEHRITALAAEGLSYGVHVMLSASRWAEIRPSLKDQAGTRIELRLGDPADSELSRKAARDVPHDRPGRGLSREGLHMVIALPGDVVPQGESSAPRIPLLPALVAHDAVVDQAGDDSGAQLLLGLEERRIRPVAADFARHSHLLVFGEDRCGKTATLRTLCREVVRTRTPGQARLVIVDFRRSLLGAIESEHLDGYAMSPSALAALMPRLLEVLRERMPPADASQAQLLRAGPWWSGPEVFLVVDDYDLATAPTASPLAGVLEYLPYARDLGLHLIVARRSAGAERALFEPLLAGLRDLGCMTLMMSGCPDGGAPFGTGRPSRMPAGRGVLAARGDDDQLVQVGWSPP